MNQTTNLDKSPSLALLPQKDSPLGQPHLLDPISMVMMESAGAQASKLWESQRPHQAPRRPQWEEATPVDNSPTPYLPTPPSPARSPHSCSYSSSRVGEA